MIDNKPPALNSVLKKDSIVNLLKELNDTQYEMNRNNNMFTNEPLNKDLEWSAR